MAESFGVDPGRYDRSRPGYPRALIERIVAASPGRDVLDVGCGTGIAARQFQVAGCRVLGIDVDARMARFAKQRGLEVEVARFESWDAVDRAFDAVIAGQTWHWIEPVAGATKAAAVLRPGGQIAVFRNDSRLPPKLTKAFAEAYARVLPDLPINPHRTRAAASPATDTLAEQAVRGIQQTGAFSVPQQWTFTWQRPYTGEQWLDELPTSGLLTRLPAEKLAELLTNIAAAIETTVDGKFTADYTTTAIAATRISS